MEDAMEARTYRSPKYKLLKFFKKSRDKWRKKAVDRNTRIKRLCNRVEGLKESRGKWKEKARALQEQIARLSKELEEQKIAPL